MNYGQKIAELRKKADMTQAELGESLSVTSQAVSKWENGLSEPDLGTINKICELFNVSANDFFETTEKSVAAEDKIGNGENKNEEVPAPKIINGYCEKCHKPVGPNEYKVFKRTEKVGYDEDAVYNSVQEILCNDCAKKKEAAVLAENVSLIVLKQDGEAIKSGYYELLKKYDIIKEAVTQKAIIDFCAG